MRGTDKKIVVRYKSDNVGTLALTGNHRVAFQYDSFWLKNGFSISPFSLPLKDAVFVPGGFVFDGLFGVFADSLPDAWGKLVLDRMLREKGIDPSSLDMLDRLSIVGKNGKGALEYIPEYSLSDDTASLTIDELAEESDKILSSKDCTKINQMFSCCGSSGGARPKAIVLINGEEWIVKFIYSKDGPDFGRREYEYALCAKKSGITMSDVKLIKGVNGQEYFATKRFDRPKIHMISAASLLEVDFERSLTDYKELLKLCSIITYSNKADMECLYRLMCFNVFAGNQDDHLKNFAFLYDDQKCVWNLSPAYDLTPCTTAFGEHTTLVNGKGKNIAVEDLIEVGTYAGLKKNFCTEAASEIKRECAILKEIIPQKCGKIHYR